MSLKRIILLLVCLTGLSACGYRGALYLPEQAPQQTPETADTLPETPATSGESN